MKTLAVLLLAAVALISHPGIAGTMPAPMTQRATVGPHGADVYRVDLHDGHDIRLRVISEKSESLSVGVYDSRGKLLAEQISETGDVSLVWRLASAERCSIRVRNEMDQPVEYLLMLTSHD